MTLWQSDKARRGPRPLFQFWLRAAQTAPPVVSHFCRFMLAVTRFIYKVEIASSTRIGPGLYIGHPYCITINTSAVLGSNINIHKGVTIGRESRGHREGVPTIGNCVWIGVNATIVGRVTIGDDVLIAPNTFVNCDVPPHSVVFGNPCIIKHRDNATEGYILNRV
ncbi:MAG: serine acetyltransferase [Muribaculaceae bacterium]|nr:serine acetyltransferase [Muribaculaceae bacterium]